MNTSTSQPNCYYKIAHRGYSEIYGDNNIHSFEMAIEENFDMIEMDLQLSKDEDIVVYHDMMIDGTLICQLSTTSLVDDHNIVTLDSLLKLEYSDKIKLNFDLKGNNTRLVGKLLVALEEHNVNIQNIYISSFNRKLLQSLIESQRLDGHEYHIGFITCNVFTIHDLRHLLYDVDFFVISIDSLDHEVIYWCRSKNIQVFVYTNLNEHTYKQINPYKVDGIITNCLIS